MTQKFQACIGPAAHTLHLIAVLDVGQLDLPLTVCKSTTFVRRYKGAVSVNNAKLCTRCFRAAEKSLASGEALNAETIGVSAIED